MGGVEDKFGHAMSKRMELLVVPFANYKKLDFAETEKRDYLERSVRWAKTFVDLLEVTIEGEFINAEA